MPLKNSAAARRLLSAPDGTVVQITHGERRQKRTRVRRVDVVLVGAQMGQLHRLVGTYRQQRSPELRQIMPRDSFRYTPAPASYASAPFRRIHQLDERVNVTRVLSTVCNYAGFHRISGTSRVNRVKSVARLRTLHVAGGTCLTSGPHAQVQHGARALPLLVAAGQANAMPSGQRNVVLRSACPGSRGRTGIRFCTWRQ